SVLVTLDREHNLTESINNILLYSDANQKLNGEFKTKVYSSNQLYFTPTDSAFDYKLNTKSKSLLLANYLDIPFEIYRDGTLLEPGTHYLISLDNEKTFSSNINYTAALGKSIVFAGDF